MEPADRQRCPIDLACCGQRHVDFFAVTNRRPLKVTRSDLAALRSPPVWPSQPMQTQQVGSAPVQLKNDLPSYVNLDSADSFNVETISSTLWRKDSLHHASGHYDLTSLKSFTP